MKATDFAAYESPKTTVMTVYSEGVLCASNPIEFGWNHDGFTEGDNLDFSDWSN